MVPILQWGFVRSNLALAIFSYLLVQICFSSGLEFDRLGAPREVALIASNSLYASFAFTSSATFRSEEHTSELQSLMRISYAVFCLKKKSHSTENTKALHLLYNSTYNE